MDTFSTDFIKAKHTFPVVAKRKVTDVFVMERRANRLRPAEDGSAALGANVESFASKTATNDDSVLVDEFRR